MAVSNGSIPFESHYMTLGCNPFAICTCQEFPVFRPNEFFWKTYQKVGEEKWQTYARVVREMMGKELSLELSDQSFNDKVEYRKLVFGGKFNPTD